MGELQIYNNEEFGDIRTVTIENEPWFVGKDVAEALGYSNSRKALCLGNAIKYLWRHEHKNGYEDIEKAGVYLDKVDELISDDSTSYRDSELYEALSSIHLHELEKYKERTEQLESQ